MTVLDRFRLDGKLTLVTGSSRGIGLAMAVALAEAGADIIGVSANMPERDGELERAVRATGRSIELHRADFSNRADVRSFAQSLTDRPIDILINNAGTIRREPAAEHREEFWDEVLEVNLTSQFLLSQHIGRQMVARGRGKVIFTASLLTFQGGINVPGYAASKGAIGQLVKALANEWAAHGVQVNAIAPGYISTDNTRDLRADGQRSAAILSRIPAGRWGEPADFAGAAVFLASPASDYVNGTILTVDGGWMGR